MKKITTKNLIYTGIFAATIVLNIFLILRCIAVEKLWLEEKELYTKKSETCKMLFIRDLELRYQKIAINSQQFNDCIRLEKFPKLVYAYSGDECNKCVFEDIFILKEKMIKYKIKDVIVLPVLEDTRNTHISLNTDLESFRYKLLDKESIIFPSSMDGSSVRFFCILDSIDNISIPFFPDKNSPERTEDYLDFVLTNFFEKNGL
ncbi:MAG TPA: hypothetical protein DHV48_10475 [Prolixibacteraceae bacterium]|nr:hypothetical protein [Prolixibacteraceae bacterium]